jgi:hypothetical protein
MKPSLNEKSRCFKELSKLTKKTKPADVLVTLNELCGGEFTFEKLVGKCATAYVTQSTFKSAEGEDVTFNQIEALSPAKKTITAKAAYKPKKLVETELTGEIWLPVITEFVEGGDVTKSVGAKTADKVMDKTAKSAAVTDVDDFFDEAK